MAQSCQVEMAKYVDSLRRSTNREKLVTFWKASLLSTLPMRVLDVVSNTIMAAMETGKHPLASALDRAASKMTGLRARAWSMDDLSQASFATVQKLKSDMGMALKGGDPFDNARKLDQVHGEVQYTTPIIGGPLTAAVNGVFRVMNATDMPFTRLAFERSMREQGRLRGMSAGLSGQQLSRYVQDYMRLPVEEDVVRAFHDALTATFKDDTPLAKALTNMKRGVRGVPGAETAAELFFPFTRIPSNIAHRTVEYSGAGWLMGAINLRRAFNLATNGDRSEAVRLQAYAVDQMARGSLGVAAIAAGYWLAEQGRMTLGYPDAPGERGMWEATGKTENSVRIGDKWYPVIKIPPVGPLMVVGAYLHRAAQGENVTPLEMASTMVGALGSTVSDQPALQGAEQLTQIKDDLSSEEHSGEGFGRWVERTASGMVPGMIARAAQWVDPTVREREGLIQAFQARIPGLSASLPARTDVFGQTVTRRDPSDGALEHFANNFLNPFSPKPDRTARNDFLKELDRVGFTLSRQRRGAGEDPDAFYRRRELEGTIMRDVLLLATQSEEYQAIPEFRRWAAQSVPGINPRQLDARIRDEQREFLAAVAQATRSALSQARRAGEPLQLQDGTDWLADDALTRATNRIDNRRQDEMPALTP